MAHFYGTVTGQRGQASRLGSKKSGLETVAASYQGAVKSVLWHDEKTGKDMVTVALVPWQGAGTSQILYEGPVNGEVPEGQYSVQAGRGILRKGGLFVSIIREGVASDRGATPTEADALTHYIVKLLNMAPHGFAEFYRSYIKSR